MAHTAGHVFVTGELFTAATGNTYISDNDDAAWPYTMAGQGAISASSTTLTAKVPAWNPDAIPASAGALDDEYNSGALTGWTEFDVDGLLTTAVGNGGYKATISTHADPDYTGIYKADPTGNITVWTKVSFLGAPDTNYLVQGIGIWDNNATPANKKIGAFVAMSNATGAASLQLLCAELASYNGAVTTKIAAVTIPQSLRMIYLRMRRNGTNYYMEYSLDGIGWRSANAGSAVTFSFTSSYIGLLGENATGATQYTLAQFFRSVNSDVGLSGIMTGAFTF